MNKSSLTAENLIINDEYKEGRSYLIGNRTGGQGKTLLSQLLYFGLKDEPFETEFFSADTTDSGISQSKLGRLLPSVKELGIGASLSEIEGDGEAAIEHWDEIGGVLKRNNAVIDVGANVLPQILEWGEKRQVGMIFEKLHPVILLVPVTTQRQSVVDAIYVIDQALKLQEKGGIQFERIVIVFNEVWGKFEDIDDKDDELKKLIYYKDKALAGSVLIDKCISPVWKFAEAHFIPIHKLAVMGGDGYSASFGFNEFKANGAYISFVSWARLQIKRLRDAGLLPSGIDREGMKDIA